MLVRKFPEIGKGILALTAVLTIVLLWSTNQVESGKLLFEVPQIARLNFLETPYIYVWLLVFTLFFPLIFSFDRRIGFFQNWKYFFPGNLLVAAIFIGWDVFFTKSGVWAFNERYLTGLKWLGLPWEEWLFFIIVPFSCTFIYDALHYFIKKDWLAPFEKKITLALMLLFFTVGFLKWESIYTSTTFLLCGFLTLFHLLFLKKSAWRGRFYLAYLVSWIPFLLVNGVLTGGFTQEPVVVYNPAEYFGIRIGSVPLDDSAYSFLMLLGNISLYEYFKRRARNVIFEKNDISAHSPTVPKLTPSA